MAAKFSNSHSGTDSELVVTNKTPVLQIRLQTSVHKILNPHSFSFLCTCHVLYLVSQETASSSAECSRDKLPFSFVRQDSTMWDIVSVSPQGHRSVSVSHHFLLPAPQCPCSVLKQFNRDHCCKGRSKPGCRILESHTRWELTTWADFQLYLHRLLTSIGCRSSYNGFLDVNHNNGGLRISGWVGQLSCLTIFSTSLSVAAFIRRAGGSIGREVWNAGCTAFTDSDVCGTANYKWTTSKYKMVYKVCDWKLVSKTALIEIILRTHWQESILSAKLHRILHVCQCNINYEWIQT